MRDELALRVHRTWLGPSPLLGPSLWVWVQGCPKRCAGCFNVEALSFNGGEPTLVSDLASQCTRAAVNLVLSGGEPFSHAKALAALCRRVRAERPETEILAYSGYRLEELVSAGDADCVALLAELDLLVDGPYERDRATDHALTGSENQRMIFLSARIERARVERLSEPRLVAELAGRQLRLIGTGSSRTDMHGLVAEIRAQGVVLEREAANAE